MRFLWNLKNKVFRSGGVIFLAFLVCAINNHQSAASSPKPVKVTNNSMQQPGMLDLLQKVIQDKELSKPESLKFKPALESKSNSRKTAEAHFSDSKKLKSKRESLKSSLRTDILRQELSKESNDNCLAKLLCGPGYALPPSSSQQQNTTTGVLNNYAVLVKEFLDIFSDDPIDDKKDKGTPPKKDISNAADDSEEEDNDDEDNDDDARMGEKFVNITGSLVSNSNEITTSTTSTISSITTGATVTELHQSTLPAILKFANPTADKQDSDIHKITLEELVSEGESNLRKALKARQSRKLKTPRLTFGSSKQSKYINRKIREMQFAKTESQKLRIASKIAKSLRQPRQCKEFQNIASEILTTCPLTAEVIRYFNSNLKNGSQIALLKQTHNSTEGGLVVLNDRNGSPHPYFLDNSPIIANTYINTDLKNPSVGDRFPLEDIRHPIYENKPFQNKFDTSIVSLANVPTTKKPKQKIDDSEEDDEEESDENDEERSDLEEAADEDSENEEEEDEGKQEEAENVVEDEAANDETEGKDENEVQNVEEDESEKDDIENKTEDEEDGSNDDTEHVEDDEVQNDEEELEQERSEKRRFHKTTSRYRTKVKVQQKKKKETTTPAPKKTLRKGIIKVYGISQPSFDNEFTKISTQIGSGPILLFDQDDEDADEPHPGPPVRKSQSSPQPKPVISYKTKETNKKPYTISKPAKNRVTESEEDENEDEEEEDDEVPHQRSPPLKKTQQHRRPQKQQQHQRQQTPPRHRPNPAYRRPHNFATTPSYGSFPAPRPEEYYHNGKPLRPRPPTPYGMKMPMSYRPRPEIKSRLNFVQAPGLMRPSFPRPNPYRRFAY